MLPPARTRSRLNGSMIGRLASGALVAVLATGSAQPLVHAAPPAGGHIDATVWLPYWQRGAVDDISASASAFSSASLFWYDASCSNVRRSPGAGGSADVARLKARGLHVIATVVGGGLPASRAVHCFNNNKRRHAHVRQLVRLAVRGRYAGIDIDYETLAHTTRPHQARRVRAAFDRFVDDLCPALHRHGKTCSVTVMPRVDDSYRRWHRILIPAVYDYRTIARTADRMRVMAYDEHGRNSNAGPIAGAPWVRRVIAYTATKARLAKVQLGIPTYGRDFSHHASIAMSTPAALALARRHGVRPHFDAVQREGRFVYHSSGVRHVVWFSNPRAVAFRTRLAVTRRLAGTAYWAAGLERAGTWRAVRIAQEK